MAFPKRMINPGERMKGQGWGYPERKVDSGIKDKKTEIEPK